MHVRRTIIAGLVIAGAMLGAPVSAVAATDIALRFGAPVRTVIDTGPAGTTVGDLTITTGDVRRTEGGRVIGYYTTNQITVRADAAAGREIRKVEMSISLPDGMIFATSLIRAQAGVPPTQRMTFAVTGGTGTYAGARGTLTHEGVAGKPGFAVEIELE